MTRGLIENYCTALQKTAQHNVVQYITLLHHLQVKVPFPRNMFSLERGVKNQTSLITTHGTPLQFDEELGCEISSHAGSTVQNRRFILVGTVVGQKGETKIQRVFYTEMEQLEEFWKLNHRDRIWIIFGEYQYTGDRWVFITQQTHLSISSITSSAQPAFIKLCSSLFDDGNKI